MLTNASRSQPNRPSGRRCAKESQNARSSLPTKPQTNATVLTLKIESACENVDEVFSPKAGNAPGCFHALLFGQHVKFV
jgi:hypothetical protein